MGSPACKEAQSCVTGWMGVRGAGVPRHTRVHTCGCAVCVPTHVCVSAGL